MRSGNASEGTTERRALPGSFAKLESAGGEPDLVSDDGHHEDEVEAEGPDDGEFGAVEVAAGDGMFFGSDELVGFEGGKGEGSVGGGD